MSGPFGASQWMYNAGSDFYPHSIAQSLRFEDGDSSYLSRTPSSNGNRQIWTWSAWIKRGNLGGDQLLFDASSVSSNQCRIYIRNNNDFQVDDYNGSFQMRLTPSPQLRDVSSFYHFVVSVDTTQSTASNRAKVYINGTLQTSFINEIYPSQNYETNFNQALAHSIGRRTYNNDFFFDGYISEVNFIDGTALTADSFGETKDGIWVPKDVSGLTYGTNGFHLDLADSSAIGNDVSGQNNDFAVSGLAATDVVLDSPTNGFPTANPLAKSSMVTLSEGNLKVAGNSASNSGNVTVSPVVTSGKWYFEYLVAKNDGDTNYPQIAAYRSGLDEHRPFINGGTGTGGQVASFFSLALGLTNGDILGIAVDADGGTVKFYDNNSYISGKDIDISAYDSTGIWIGIGEYNTGFGYLNFGQDSSFAGNKTAQGNGAAHEDFFYAPPSGYSGLNLGNFDEPEIIDGSQYFTSYIYTANNASTRDFTGIGFAPNFLWFKNRTTGFSHALYDTVRGVNKGLQTNNTSAENSYTLMTAFGADGFSTANDGTAGNALNYNTDAYVAWAWKAGGSAVSNSDGTITSSISANPEAGFSIVSWTGNNTDGATVGHGLSSAPEMVINKSRSAISNSGWHVFHKDLTANYNLLLNSTDAVWQPASTGWLGATTNSIFTLENGSSSGVNVNPNGVTMITYCFHSVEGYSKVGSYTGSGSTAFIHCGFRPAWVMIRRTNTAAGWGIIDNKRNPYNSLNGYINANSSSAEGVGTAGTKYVDFLSNGFRCISSDAGFNASGDNYIFLAFAEQPFKYSNAR